MLSNRIILGAILFYPYEIILCRDAAVLAVAAGVIALGVFPADNLAGGVGAVYLRHVREADSGKGAEKGGEESRGKENLSVGIHVLFS